MRRRPNDDEITRLAKTEEEIRKLKRGVFGPGAGAAFSGASVKVTVLASMAPAIGHDGIVFGTAELDTDGYWEDVTHPDRLTVLADGIYVVTFSYIGTAYLSSGEQLGCWTQLFMEGSIEHAFGHELLIHETDETQTEAFTITSTPVECAAGDYWYVDPSIHTSHVGDDLVAYGDGQDPYQTRFGIQRVG